MRKTLGSPLEESQVWENLQSLVRILAYLEENNIFHGAIHLNNFFASQNKIIIGDFPVSFSSKKLIDS